MSFLTFFSNQILGQAFILLAIVVFTGYIALRKPVSTAIGGALKAAVGILVLSIGAGQLVTTFGALIRALNQRFGMTGVLLDVYSTMAACNQALGAFAYWSVYTLLLAFFFNLLLVALRRYTRIRAVFLTGNIMIVQATIATYVVYRFLATPMILTIVIAALIVSIYWGVMSTLLIKPTEAVTNGAGFTIGHQQMLADYITYKIAGKIGSPENNVEKLRLPTWLSIIQDNVAASSILLLVAASAMMFVMGQETVMKMAAGKNWVIYIFTTGLTLAADLYVLMQGVRLFVGELMVLFTGISERLLPGAIVAVDCVAIFGFAPKAVLLGVVCAAIGQIVGITGLIIFKCPILIIPGFIPLFFDNATIGVFANRFGGWRAAAVLPFCSGMLQVTGTALAASMMQLNFWQGSFDYATLWVVIIAIFRFIGRALGITPL